LHDRNFSAVSMGSLHSFQSGQSLQSVNTDIHNRPMTTNVSALRQQSSTMKPTSYRSTVTSPQVKMTLHQVHPLTPQEHGNRLLYIGSTPTIPQVSSVPTLNYQNILPTTNLPTVPTGTSTLKNHNDNSVDQSINHNNLKTLGDNHQQKMQHIGRVSSTPQSSVQVLHPTNYVPISHNSNITHQPIAVSVIPQNLSVQVQPTMRTTTVRQQGTQNIHQDSNGQKQGWWDWASSWVGSSEAPN